MGRRQRPEFRPCEPGYGITWHEDPDYRIRDLETGTWVKLRAPMTEDGVRGFCLLDPERYQAYAVTRIFHATRLIPAPADEPAGVEA